MAKKSTESFSAIGIFKRQVRAVIMGTAHIFLGSKKSDGLRMIGHRGYSSKHVDNTEESFIAAAKHGSDGVETDVRFTKDKVLVLSHDGDLHFNDGTFLKVAESTYDELSAKPLANAYNDNDVYVCTFKRYLEICKQYGMICFIEFKGSFTDELISAAFNMAADAYDLKKCSLQSSSMDNLVRAHALFPALAIMLTYGRGDNKKDYDRCLEYGFSIDMDYLLANKKMVDEFHSRGLEFGVWTCNTKTALNYGYSLGADYIESNVF